MDHVQKTCPNCEAPQLGRYCHGCGQDNRRDQLKIRDWWGDLLDGISNLNSVLVRTIVHVFLRPGTTARLYVTGRRQRYLSPIRFAVLACAFWWVAVAYGVSLDEESERKFAEMSRSEQLLWEHGQVFNLVLLPLLAIPLHLIYWDSKTTVAETLSLTLFFGGLIFTWRGVMGLIGPNAPVPEIAYGIADQVLFLVYLIACLRGFHAGRVKGQWLRIPLAVVGILVISALGMLAILAVLL